MGEGRKNPISASAGRHFGQNREKSGKIGKNGPKRGILWPFTSIEAGFGGIFGGLGGLEGVWGVESKKYYVSLPPRHL